MMLFSMRKKVVPVAGLILLSLMFFSVSGTTRADDSMEGMASELLALINEARRAPLASAASFGLDPDQVLNDLPDLAEILTQGLAPLTLNGQLSGAALEHTRDMLHNNYYGKISPDGRSSYERIVESGYEPWATGETLGILAFYNFIAPDSAVGLLFKNMFLDELDPQRTDPRNILSPNLNEVGIGVGTGAMALDGRRYNVYLSTCDFASRDFFAMEHGEKILLHLINQARAEPLRVAESLGVDPDRLLADLPELSDVLNNGLPPLALNPSLRQVAREHTLEMIEHRFLDYDTVDGLSFQDRIRASGYDSLVLGESLGLAQRKPDVRLADAVQKVFQRLFLAELDGSYPVRRNILNPDFSEVGIGMGELRPKADEYFMPFVVATCDFGLPAGRTGQHLMGLIFRDMDGDGLYTPGEGMPGVVAYIDYPHDDVSISSDATGGFQLLLGPGPTRIVLWPQKVNEESWVDIWEDNVRFVYAQQP